MYSCGKATMFNAMIIAFDFGLRLHYTLSWSDH
jgi:hypothetical protein